MEDCTIRYWGYLTRLRHARQGIARLATQLKSLNPATSYTVLSFDTIISRQSRVIK